ncbi:hypothetical protein F4860DRAFT_481716 [Xylaria cubensis]|nr:hypothetical protein F4860DRAFT_481716 [Xylaria cubensis]
MPPYRRHQLDEQLDGLWKENESILRRLYLKEHKTLKEVKKAMESEYGFPTTPLSTYESKLRDLGLRKKMKSKDWRPVYRHYINSGSRHTALYFNGTRIPWDKAWKEIRRSGVRELNDGETIELPNDVVMRTPSPVVPQSAFTLRKGRGLAPAPWNLSNQPLDGLSSDAIFRRLTLYDIPSNLLRIEMLSTLEQPLIQSRMENNEFTFNHHCLPNSANASTDPALPHTSTLALFPGLNNGNLTSDINRLSNALYQLANLTSWNFDDYSLVESLNGALDAILDLAPKHHILSSIFKGNSSAIRAATERMVGISTALKRKDDFRIFIEAIGRYHPEWIPKGQYLVSAGRIGCVKTCRLLLRMPNQSQYAPSCGRYKYDYTTAVLESMSRGHFECAEFLCQHAIKLDINFPSPEDTFATNVFCRLLEIMTYDNSYSLFDSRPFNLKLKNPNSLQILNCFLEAGASVDAPGPSRGQELRKYMRHTPKWWMPTILDDTCFKSPELYSHLVGYSVKSRIELTRSGIYCSAKEGIDSLLIYLRSRPSHTPIQQTKLLSIFLTEMLLRSVDFSLSETNYHEQNVKIIHTLLNYNINLPQFGSSMNVSAMLYYVVRGARLHGITYPITHYIMKTLSCKGAVIVAETLAEAIEPEGITLLQLLSSYGPDFKNQGALALCVAISLNNFDAISWLRNRGVDINATISVNGERNDVTILARANEITVPTAHEFDIFGYKLRFDTVQGSGPISYEMLEYLISQNIKLRANPHDLDMRKLLHLIIRNGTDSDWTGTIEKTQLLLNAENIPEDPSDAEPCLLEACFTCSPHYNISGILDLVELLLDHGISFKNSGILAVLIKYDAPIDIIQRFLDDGVNVNVYCGQGRENSGLQRTPLQAAASVRSLDLVQLLIQRGADVNKPAKGREGKTALQAACYGGSDVNIDLIKLLIANGADVNAPPALEFGWTALQAATHCGNFEVTLLLLDHGADINASPSAHHGYGALDGAAYWGKVDMVYFLLELGALSCDGGESGYKNAIRIAEGRQLLAIADMIRQHALKNGRVGEELYAHYTQWGDYKQWTNYYGRWDYPGRGYAVGGLGFSGYDSDNDDSDDDDSDDDDSDDDASNENEIGLEDQNYWEGLLSL